MYGQENVKLVSVGMKVYQVIMKERFCLYCFYLFDFYLMRLFIFRFLRLEFFYSQIIVVCIVVYLCVLQLLLVIIFDYNKVYFYFWYKMDLFGK